MQTSWHVDENNNSLLQKDDGSSTLLASVEFDNEDGNWYGFDFSHPLTSQEGCRKVGPFDLREEAEQAVEKSVASDIPGRN